MIKKYYSFLSSKALWKSIRIALVVILCLYPYMAMAISSQRYNIEQAFNFDSTDCSNSQSAFTGGGSVPSSPTGSNPTAPGKVVLIGDSVLNRTKDAITQSFHANNTGWNIVFDGLDSRKLDGTPPSPDGQTAIQNRGSDIKDASAVVLVLGTNSTLNQSDVSKAIDTIRSSSYNGPIYWVNNVVVNRDDYEKTMEANDVLLNTLAPQKNFTVVDWKGVVLPGHTDYIDTSDGVNAHPNAIGSVQFANLVVNAVANGSTATVPSSNVTDPCSAQCTSPGFSGGSTLPPGVPDPWRTLFSQAAAKFNVNPQFLAAIFLDENGNVWKPFNYPWKSNEKSGASGPFQFMPGTWQSNKQDGDGDGKEDINNIYDAAYAAANLLHNLGTDTSTPLGTLDQPFKPGTILAAAAGYNWGSGNVQRVTGSPLSAAPTETQNYVKNTYALITSGFTKSGNPNYGDPRIGDQPAQTNSTSAVGGVNTTVCSGGATTVNGIVYYFQTDPQWATHPYGDSNIKDSGCGPTTMAVIASTLTGDSSITPITTADIGTKNNDYIPGAGSSFKLFSDVTNQYHLKLGSDMGKNIDAITKSLRAGHLVIASMHAGHFTVGGHIMVLRGITTDGKIQVVDVGESTAHHPKTDTDWDPQIIVNEGDHFFEVTK